MASNISRYRSVGKNLTAGSPNTVYTCPDNHTAKLELTMVANTGSSNKSVSIAWNEYSESGSFKLVGGYVIAANGYLRFDNAYLSLSAGDTIVMTPEAGSTMDATISVEEFFNPAHKKG